MSEPLDLDAIESVAAAGNVYVARRMVTALAAELRTVRALRRDAIKIGYENAKLVVAVHVLVARARQVSSSPSMTLYVSDVERALGMEAPRPHKTGANDGGSEQ